MMSRNQAYDGIFGSISQEFTVCHMSAHHDDASLAASNESAISSGVRLHQ